jgi:hypothetical protein
MTISLVPFVTITDTSFVALAAMSNDPSTAGFKPKIGDFIKARNQG